MLVDKIPKRYDFLVNFILILAVFTKRPSSSHMFFRLERQDIVIVKGFYSLFYIALVSDAKVL